MKTNKIITMLFLIGFSLAHAASELAQAPDKLLGKAGEKISGEKSSASSGTEQSGTGHTSSTKTSYGTDINVNSIVSVVVNNCQGSEGSTVNCGNNARLSINQPNIDSAGRTFGANIANSALRSVVSLGEIGTNSRRVRFAIPERNGQITSYSFKLTAGPDAGKTVIVALRREASAKPKLGDTLIELYANIGGEKAVVSGREQLYFNRVTELFFNMKPVKAAVDTAKRKDYTTRATLTYVIEPDGEAVLEGDDSGNVIYFDSNAEITTL